MRVPADKVIVRAGLVRIAALLLLATYAGLPIAWAAGGSGQLGPGDVAPIMAGDHPDPTIVRIGTTYWTTSTSGDWAPVFALYRSTDLVRWKAAGAVFSRPPAWATGSFWAPEMVADKGRVLLYYVARQRDGPLCVAVAAATHAEGPYTDHGPVVCEPDGSIDPSFVRDENGKPYLIWKEDGNSIRKPTPIWAQPLSNNLLHVTGDKTQLLVNDEQSWEGGVVEGPYVLRHGGRFYLFYAGNACCGEGCRYAEGVARADRLLGPWEKDPDNPIIKPNKMWKCPGHGTAVETPAGEDYLLYHAYPAMGTVYLGRESVLDPIAWSADGWPVINEGRGGGRGRERERGQERGQGASSEDDQSAIGRSAAAASIGFSDSFSEPVLDPEWKWPVGAVEKYPVFKSGKGGLTIEGSEGGSFVARSLPGADYSATVSVGRDGEMDGGIGIFGDARNQVVIACHDARLELLRLSDEGRKVLWQTEINSSATVWLRVSSHGPAEASFSYSFDGTKWLAAGPAESVADVPRWDQGLRIGLIATGGKGTRVRFTRFSMSDLQGTSSKD